MEAESKEGIDPTCLRNAVEEPIEEAGVEIEKEPETVKPEGLFCSKCGIKLPEDSVFCNKCGASVE